MSKRYPDSMVKKYLAKQFGVQVLIYSSYIFRVHACNCPIIPPQGPVQSKFDIPSAYIFRVHACNCPIILPQGPVQSKFERIQSGSLPPKVTHVSCEASPQDRFIIHARLETRDLSFLVFASQQTHEGVKLTNCTASVLRLKGTLRIQSYREGADVKMSFNFEGKPEIKVEVKPLNPYQEANELVDLGVVEANVRNSIILAKTTFTVTHLLMPGDLQTVNHDQGGQGPDKGGQDQGKGSNHSSYNLLQRDIQSLQKQKPATQNSAPSQPSHQQQTLQQQQLPELSQEIVVPTVIPPTNKAPPIHSISVQNEPVQSIPIHPIHRQLQQDKLQQEVKQVPRRDQQRVRPQSRPEGVFEPVEAMNLSSSLFSAPPKPHRMVGDKRLLVKVIKANGLTLKQIGAANLVCMVSTDEPLQGYATSIVKNTQNPFWDEHFLFDITQESQEVRVEMYDKDKAEGDEFLGEAIVYVEDLRKTPSSRQILRLHPQPGNFEYNAGTVTAEFLFMDPVEADLLLGSMTTTSNNQLSPRRRIEIARSVTPGGTVVTKTTTTTQRPQYGRHDPGPDGSPNYVEKNIYAEDSPQFSYSDSPSNVSSETINGEDSVAAAALRDIQQRSWQPRSHAKSSTIIITGVKRQESPRPKPKQESPRPKPKESPRLKAKQESPRPKLKLESPRLKPKTIESPDVEEDATHQYQVNQSYNQQPQPIALKDKKKGGFGSAILKKFGRKKRAQSADRTLSMREGAYLKPPEPAYGPQSKDDLELVRPQSMEAPPSPNLKKSRTLGGSLKKLFKRSRKRSQTRGDSRESSLSRGSRSKGPSRDSSLTRQNQRESDQRASSVS
ncbi:phospholipid transfer protein C2CD2L-like [Physella acuta]|uniref:phospholipid transfer protein C2CD2L-like n=1 Tax=Physella acuta TaxID=109671 RepID=UPI0027DE6397|nr:phospholipid transfer protein C2CD2L-like [Physella acuta]